MLEHFGFMEFLNLTHSAATDSVQAQKKEIFDNYADIATRDKKEFNDGAKNQDEDDEESFVKMEEAGVPIQTMNLSEKMPSEIRDCFLLP